MNDFLDEINHFIEFSDINKELFTIPGINWILINRNILFIELDWLKGSIWIW